MSVSQKSLEPRIRVLPVFLALLLLSSLSLVELGSLEGASEAEKGEGQKVRASQPSSDPPPPPADHLPVESELSCSDAVDQPPSEFQVRVTPEQEKRAMAIYRRSIVITAHGHCFHPEDFRDMRKAGITAQGIKLTTDGIYWRGAIRYRIDSEVAGWEERGKEAIRILEEEVARSQGKIVIVRSVADIERAKREDKLAVILSFEGARPLAGNLQNLEKFYKLGLRDLQLFWAVPNPLKKADGTLSDFGIQVIGEMNRLGMVMDFSHMSAAAFDQAIGATRDPIVISHCAVAAVSGPTERRRGGTDHLDDATIRAIAENEGVICLHFYEGYIKPRHGPHATVEDYVDHIDHIKNLVGIDYVALGVDYFPEKGYYWVESPKAMRGGMVDAVREMVRRGYTDQEIEKVMGLNLMRVYRRVWGE